MDARERSFALWAQFADRTVRSAADLDVVGWINPDGTADYRHYPMNYGGEDLNYPGDFLHWTDLVSINVNRGITVGTQADGTVLYTAQGLLGNYTTTVLDWSDMILAYYDYSHIVGLKADGTVHVECFWDNSRCTLKQTASEWTDAIAICAAAPLVALRADGTLLTATCTEHPVESHVLDDLAAMNNVVAIRTRFNIMAMFADGTVRTVGDGIDIDMGAPFDELTMFPNSPIWFPKDLQTLEEPPRDRALIAASFPPAEDTSAAYYAEAEKHLAQGQLALAAIAFGKAGDYQDAVQRSSELWVRVRRAPTIHIDRWGQVFALRQDGTVWHSRGNAVPAGQFVALSHDGRNLWGRNQAGTLILIDALTHYAPVPNGIAAFETYDQDRNDFTVHIKSDGTLAATNRNAPAWNNVVDISFQASWMFAILSDGTVRCSEDLSNSTGLEYENTLISATDAVKFIRYDHNCSFILRADGTILGPDWLLETYGISSWTGLVDAAVNEDFIFGLNSDGTVLVSASNCKTSSDYGFEAAQWTDIVAITACEYGVLGLRSDGTLCIAVDSEMPSREELLESVRSISGLMVPNYE